MLGGIGFEGCQSGSAGRVGWNLLLMRWPRCTTARGCCCRHLPFGNYELQLGAARLGTCIRACCCRCCGTPSSAASPCSCLSTLGLQRTDGRLPGCILRTGCCGLWLRASGCMGSQCEQAESCK